MEQEVSQLNKKERAADSLALASFVVGIFSLVSMLCCCPFVFSAIGIVLALLSKGAEKTLRPRAKAGLVMSVIGIGISLILTVFTITLPLVMYKTNPEFRKNFDNAMTESLKQDEELFRQLYGDEVYDQMMDMFGSGKLQEDSL